MSILNALKSLFCLFGGLWLPLITQSHNFSPILTQYNTCMAITDAKATHYFLTEIANTDKKRSLGMMFRPKIEKNEAMLFIFAKDQQLNFWMKNMQIPLDMLFFDASGKLQEIKSNVPPCKTAHCPTYPSQQSNNRYVLEIKSGAAKQYQLNLGAQLQQTNKTAANCHE